MSSIVKNIFDKTSPIRTVMQRKQEPHKSWIDEDILNEIMNKNSLHDQFLNSENDKEFE